MKIFTMSQSGKMCNIEQPVDFQMDSNFNCILLVIFMIFVIIQKIE